MEGIVPDLSGSAGRFEPEFKRHTTENQPQQHEDDRDIERRHQHGICQGKGGEHTAAAQDQPCFVTIPEGGDRIHHSISGCVGGGKRKQNSDTQVESVQQNIEKYGHSNQAIPDERQIEEPFETKHVYPLSR